MVVCTSKICQVLHVHTSTLYMIEIDVKLGSVWQQQLEEKAYD